MLNSGVFVYVWTGTRRLSLMTSTGSYYWKVHGRHLSWTLVCFSRQKRSYCWKLLSTTLLESWRRQDHKRRPCEERFVQVRLDRIYNLIHVTRQVYSIAVTGHQQLLRLWEVRKKVDYQHVPWRKSGNGGSGERHRKMLGFRRFRNNREGSLSELLMVFSQTCWKIDQGLGSDKYQTNWKIRYC